MKDTWFQNLRILVISTMVFLFILEIGFRIYFRDEYSIPNHRNIYFKKIWFEKYGNLNSLGHRDNEFTIAKPPNTYRILVIGDSLTYGEGVKNIEDLYTEILEKKLNEERYKYRFQVLNLAHPGNNVKEYLDTLKNPGLSYDPDLIMISFYLNDIERSKKNRPKFKVLPGPAHWFLSRISFVYHYAYCSIESIVQSQKWIDYYLSYCKPDSNDWKRFEAYWKEILSICTERGIYAVVVILPVNGYLNDDHPFISVYENVASLSKDNNAAVLNLFPYLKGQNSMELRVGFTDGHPNEKAHKIYADAIYQFLRINEDHTKIKRKLLSATD